MRTVGNTFSLNTAVKSRAFGDAVRNKYGNAGRYDYAGVFLVFLDPEQATAGAGATNETVEIIVQLMLFMNNRPSLFLTRTTVDGNLRQHVEYHLQNLARTGGAVYREISAMWSRWCAFEKEQRASVGQKRPAGQAPLQTEQQKWNELLEAKLTAVRRRRQGVGRDGSADTSSPALRVGGVSVPMKVRKAVTGTVPGNTWKRFRATDRTAAPGRPGTVPAPGALSLWAAPGALRKPGRPGTVPIPGVLSLPEGPGISFPLGRLRFPGPHLPGASGIVLAGGIPVLPGVRWFPGMAQMLLRRAVRAEGAADHVPRAMSGPLVPSLSLQAGAPGTMPAASPPAEAMAASVVQARVHAWAEVSKGVIRTVVTMLGTDERMKAAYTRLSSLNRWTAGFSYAGDSPLPNGTVPPAGPVGVPAAGAAGAQRARIRVPTTGIPRAVTPGAPPDTRVVGDMRRWAEGFGRDGSTDTLGALGTTGLVLRAGDFGGLMNALRGVAGTDHVAAPGMPAPKVSSLSLQAGALGARAIPGTVLAVGVLPMLVVPGVISPAGTTALSGIPGTVSVGGMPVSPGLSGRVSGAKGPPLPGVSGAPGTAPAAGVLSLPGVPGIVFPLGGSKFRGPLVMVLGVGGLALPGVPGTVLAGGIPPSPGYSGAASPQGVRWFTGMAPILLRRAVRAQGATAPSLSLSRGPGVAVRMSLPAGAMAAGAVKARVDIPTEVSKGVGRTAAMMLGADERVKAAYTRLSPLKRWTAGLSYAGDSPLPNGTVPPARPVGVPAAGALPSGTVPPARPVGVPAAGAAGARRVRVHVPTTGFSKGVTRAVPPDTSYGALRAIRRTVPPDSRVVGDMRRWAVGVGRTVPPNTFGVVYAELQLLKKEKGRREQALREQSRTVKILTRKLDLQEKLLAGLNQKQAAAPALGKAELKMVVREVVAQMGRDLRLQQLRRGLR